MTLSFRHTAFVVYVLAMVVALLLPAPALPISVPGRLDKVIHFGMFVGFALLYHVDRQPSTGRVLLVSLAFAGVIELVQWGLPFRSSDWRDFVAGAVGGATGVALARVAGSMAG